MTPFETIILIALYLFAFGYMSIFYVISFAPDKYNTWINEIILVLAAGTIGVIYFPIIFAMDIWNKLNKEEQQ